MKQVQGKLHISRVTTNIEEDYMEITLQDRASNKGIVTAKLSLSNMMNALTGAYAMPVEMTVFDTYEKVGMEKQVKHERLPFYSTTNEVFRETMAKEAKEYEVDGWKLAPEDFNHHRAYAGLYKARFFRYVEVEEDETIHSNA